LPFAQAPEAPARLLGEQGILAAREGFNLGRKGRASRVAGGRPLAEGLREGLLALL
jgi:hypothetical protein